MDIRSLAIFLFLFTSNLSSAQNTFWENVEEPSGGILFSIIVYENDIYSAGYGGVYKSTNHGEDWISLGLRDQIIQKINITSNYIFAISNSGCYRKNLSDSTWINVNKGRWQSMFAKDANIFVGSENYGLFRSTDFGNTWVETNNGINNRDIEEIFITSNNIVLASASGTSGSGVFRSTNNGDSWERIDSYQFTWNFEGIAEYNSVLYAFDFSNSAKVYKSTDFGLTWLLPENATAPSDFIQAIFVDQSGIYVGVYHYGIFKSTDEGVNWTENNSGINNKNILSINSKNSNLFCTSYDGVYRSSKANLYWLKKSSGIKNIWITTLTAYENKLVVGTYGSGLFILENNRFNRLNLGSGLMFIIDIKVTNDGIYVLSSSWTSGSQTKLYYSPHNAGYWSNINYGIGGSSQCLDLNDKFIFVGTDYGLFRKSFTGIWEKLTNGIPDNLNTSSVAASDSVVIAANGTSYIYRSTDHGSSWKKIHIQNIFSARIVYSNKSGEFYIGSSQINRTFKSVDYGMTWVEVNFPGFNSEVQAIFKNRDEIFIGLSRDGILLSQDDGENWERSNLGLESKNITSFAILENRAFAGSRYNGLYRRIIDMTSPISNDSSYNSKEITFKWTSSSGINQYRLQLSEDSLFSNLLLDNQNIFDTAYTPAYLDYNKIYYWRVSSVTKYWDNKFTAAQKVEIGNPVSFHLYQNYPNPFNNETTIKYEVPKLSWVKLELFDILGRKVTTLFNEQKTPGSYNYLLKSSELASGVYIIKISSENFSQSIKTLLLK